MVLPAELETLEALINEHMKIAKKIYHEDGEVRPMVIGYSHRERILIPLSFENDHEKEFKLKVVTMLFSVNNITRYTIGFEAWILRDVPGMTEWNRLKEKGLRISDSPLGIEVLMCMAVSRNNKLSIVNKILEDRSLEELLEDEDCTQMSGRFAELLPPKGIPKDVIEKTKVVVNSILKRIDFDFNREAFGEEK